MSLDSRESNYSEPVVDIFTRSKTFQECLERKHKNSTPSRIDEISLPTVSHLLASGYSAIKSQNQKHIRCLERLLCKKLNDPLNSIDEFVAKNRPRTPTDPYKFSNDDLDHPIFFETCEPRPGNRVKKGRIYNFRGVPRPISSRILKYRPTERIVMLSQPVRPRRRTERWSFLSTGLSTGSVSRRSWHGSGMSSRQNRTTPNTRKLGLDNCLELKPISRSRKKKKLRLSIEKDITKKKLESDLVTEPRRSKQNSVKSGSGFFKWWNSDKDKK